MSKELPYFKFEPNAWDNGNIQICSKEAKALFIDLCSCYWSRLGELPYAFALHKHCNGSKDVLEELENKEIIIVKDDQIIIEFLDEQLSEFEDTSEKRRKAANKRWSNAKAMQMHSKSNAIRGEKIRKEERKEENKIPPTLEMIKSFINEKEYKVDAERFFDFYESKGWFVGKTKMKNWHSAVRNWNRSDKPKESKFIPDTNDLDKWN